MTFDYQQHHRYFAQVSDEVVELAEPELRALGATDTSPVYRGIHFAATPETVYRINYQTRLLTRTLAPLMSFNCHSDKYLHRKASEIPWDQFLHSDRTFAVFATVSNSHIKHSKFAALRLKDAVVDYMRDKTGDRPNIDTRNPDLWLNLHIQNNKATISVDMSGGALHRRGYRAESVEAPMMETVAASIIARAEWEGETPLYDPFCGSGTLLCEAYMKAARIPAGVMRARFGFQNLPDFDQDAWDRIEQEGVKGIVPVKPGMIGGSDRSAKAVGATISNFKLLDANYEINVSQKEVFEMDGLEGYTIVCNPPYGVRMERGSDLTGFFKKFGDFLKQRCKGSTAYIYFGDREYVKALGLRPAWKRNLVNGGIEGQVAKIEIF